ncbi:MAG: DNA cytosine methyltransferase [Leptospirales bacterium]
MEINDIDDSLMTPRRISAVDLFCGAGGLTYGLKSAGINVKAGIDVDLASKYPFEFNNKSEFLPFDIKNIKAEQLQKYFDRDSYSLLAGCAPCQPFSSYAGARDTTKDPRWTLLLEFKRLIHDLKPDFVTMENVPRLAGHTVFDDFLDSLVALEYYVDYSVVACVHYGLPQTRRRLVLVASKHGSIRIPSPQKIPTQTVRQAIEKLERLVAGEVSGNDPLHRARSLSELNLRRLRASKEGGNWHDWPEELLSPCHKKTGGQSFRSVYSRMEWDKPAPTITTEFYNFGTGRFGHPEQDRAISLREAAILQGFPSHYRFTKPSEPISLVHVGRLIGNAVPPPLGEVIGSIFMEHIGEGAANESR